MLYRTIFFLFVVFAQAAQADYLQHFMQDIKSLQGSFSQLLLDQDNNIIQQSKGVFSLDRPNQFKWIYQQPYRQDIVTNGKKIWMYDEDLEQVSINEVDESLGATPAMLLSGAKDWEKHFLITDVGLEKDLYWYELKAKATQQQFELIRMGFTKQALSVLEIQDAFGQFSRIKFSNLIQNKSFPKTEFQFVIPENVDVIGE